MSVIIQYEREIELTFKIVITLASLGVSFTIIKQIIKFVKKYLFYFSELEKRVKALEEKQIKKRKPKKAATKSNEEKR